jgi:hypothetical protein
MRTYHHKIRTSTFALFVGVAAESVRTGEQPMTGEQVSNRLWLDISHVTDALRDTPRALSNDEARWLRFGIHKVADGIELVESNRYILISVKALEIVEADYTPAILAPALAGWAAAEFGLGTPRGRTTLDTTTGQYTFDWDD